MRQCVSQRSRPSEKCDDAQAESSDVVGPRVHGELRQRICILLHGRSWGNAPKQSADAHLLPEHEQAASKFHTAPRAVQQDQARGTIPRAFRCGVLPVARAADAAASAKRWLGFTFSAGGMRGVRLPPVRRRPPGGSTSPGAALTFVLPAPVLGLVPVAGGSTSPGFFPPLATPLAALALAGPRHCNEAALLLELAGRAGHRRQVNNRGCMHRRAMNPTGQQATRQLHNEQRGGTPHRSCMKCFKPAAKESKGFAASPGCSVCVGLQDVSKHAKRPRSGMPVSPTRALRGGFTDGYLKWL
jgi:hypothetical protein